MFQTERLPLLDKNNILRAPHTHETLTELAVTDPSVVVLPSQDWVFTHASLYPLGILLNAA
jgi:hypothetical protein